MLDQIIIPDNYDVSNILFFDRVNFNDLPDKRIIPLFGPNGVGKTTLLEAIQNAASAEAYLNQALEEKPYDEDFMKCFCEDIKERIRRDGCQIIWDVDVPVKVLSYFNKSDNFRNRRERSMMDAFNPYLLNARFDANAVSEGQSIMYSLLDLFDVMGTGKDALVVPDGGQLLVLLDEFDSGLSLDNLGMLMRKLKNIMRKRQDVQVVFSFNNPYVAEFFPDMISMYDGRVHHIESASDMLAEMRANKQMFDKARRKSNGRPKVYN